MKTSRKAKNSDGKVFFIGLAVVVVLVVVLWLAVFRVVNLQTTIERPRADSSFSCNDSSPDKVKSCYSDTGSCSGCWGYYNGGAYPKKSGGGGNDSSCFDNCFTKIKPGNGSYCKTYCAGGGPGDDSCFNNCFTKIKPGNGSSCKTYCANGGTNQSCFDDCFKNIKPGNGSYCKTYCANKNTSHLECATAANGSVCTKVSGAGTDTCLGEGTACGNTKNEVNACWGNSGTNGRCYDCAPAPHGDGVINILDFSCFAKHWLEDVL